MSSCCSTSAATFQQTWRVAFWVPVDPCAHACDCDRPFFRTILAITISIQILLGTKLRNPANFMCKSGPALNFCCRVGCHSTNFDNFLCEQTHALRNEGTVNQRLGGNVVFENDVPRHIYVIDSMEVKN